MFVMTSALVVEHAFELRQRAAQRPRLRLTLSDACVDLVAEAAWAACLALEEALEHCHALRLPSAHAR